MKTQMKPNKRKNEPDLKLTDGQSNKKNLKKSLKNKETKKLRNC